MLVCNTHVALGFFRSLFFGGCTAGVLQLQIWGDGAPSSCESQHPKSLQIAKKTPQAANSHLGKCNIDVSWQLLGLRVTQVEETPGKRLQAPARRVLRCFCTSSPALPLCFLFGLLFFITGGLKQN